MNTPQDGCCNRAPWDLKEKPKHKGKTKKLWCGNLGKQLFSSGPFLQTKNLRNSKTHKKIGTLKQNYNLISVILANTLTPLLHTEGTVAVEWYESGVICLCLAEGRAALIFPLSLILPRAFTLFLFSEPSLSIILLLQTLNSIFGKKKNKKQQHRQKANTKKFSIFNGQ